jgi:hypothetical protein
LFFGRLESPSMWDVHGIHLYMYVQYIYMWVNYNISPTWIKAIWRWFPLLTMIPGLSRSEVVMKFTHINIYIYIYICCMWLSMCICRYIVWILMYLVSGKLIRKGGVCIYTKPGHLNIRNLVCLHIHLNTRMELVFHTTSGASRSRPPSTYLNVVTVHMITYIYIWRYR